MKEDIQKYLNKFTNVVYERAGDFVLVPNLSISNIELDKRKEEKDIVKIEQLVGDIKKVTFEEFFDDEMFEEFDIEKVLNMVEKHKEPMRRNDEKGRSKTNSTSRRDP